IDSEKQLAARAALTNGLEEYYDKRHGYRGPEGHVPADPSDPIATWREALESRSVVGNQQPAVVTEVAERSIKALLRDGSIVGIEWDGLRWAAPLIDRSNAWPRPQNAAEIVKVGDIVRVKQSGEEWSLGQIPDLQGAIVSVSPHTADILAHAGGHAFGISQ